MACWHLDSFRLPALPLERSAVSLSKNAPHSTCSFAISPDTAHRVRGKRRTPSSHSRQRTLLSTACSRQHENASTLRARRCAIVSYTWIANNNQQKNDEKRFSYHFTIALHFCLEASHADRPAKPQCAQHTRPPRYLFVSETIRPPTVCPSGAIE